jgi:hypothetical protein
MRVEFARQRERLRMSGPIASEGPSRGTCEIKLAARWSPHRAGASAQGAHAPLAPDLARGLQPTRRMLTKTDELKDRIEAKTLALRARLKELEADSRHEAIEAKEKIEQGLSEVEQMLKDGWDKVSATIHAKLDEWLTRNN